MAFVPLRNMLSFFGMYKGKDNYTRTPVFQVNQILNGKEPLWVSVDDKEAFLFNTTPELYSVILKKAQLYSNAHIKHYKQVGDKKVEILNSEVVKRLENPNPLQSRNEWLMEEMIHTSIFGASVVYGLKGFSSQEVPTAFYNLPANRIKVVPTGKIYQQWKLEDIIERFDLVNYDGKIEEFETKDIIYSRLPNPENPLLGKSPLHALQMPISNIRGAYGYRNVLITERGYVGMVSSNNTDSAGGGIPLHGKEREAVEKQFTRDNGIFEDQNKVLISSSNLKWTPFNYPTKDLMLFEEISADLQIIIDAFGMNEYLFSKDKGATFANLEEGKKMAYQDCIIPYANDFAYKLTQYLKLDLKNEFIEFDYSHIEALQDNEESKATTVKTQAEALQVLIANGYSKDEASVIVGLK